MTALLTLVGLTQETQMHDDFTKISIYTLGYLCILRNDNQ